MLSVSRVLKITALAAVLGSATLAAEPASAHDYGWHDGYYDRGDDGDRGRGGDWNRDDAGDRYHYGHDRRWDDHEGRGYGDRDWHWRYWWYRHHHFDHDRDWY
ncbi:MAG: hypothetical protein ISR49_20780 [Alphaproteobacteria bacterium]|nr:hypothetical protein [Alphaproteobacteria bacterium]MBL6940274.1 hypothetical protein [Alphaproteobacteria bacterium]